MPDSCAALKETHQPQVLVETAGLSEKEWLTYRRKGIGGSDVAALLGISPWRTARDLYYDKLNIAAVEDNEENWVALEMGHLLEPLVAKIFQHRTGYKIYQVKKMFQHPKYPWMLADVDYFVELPDGTTAILEIKTTNYNAKDHWWLNGEETVPVYYETQGRHYMAVMDVDRCFFCCLYGNNEEETIIREIRRDEAYEDEMIFLEQHFWENYVLAKTPPPYTEEGDLVIESVRRHTGPADKDAPVVTFDYSLTAKDIPIDGIVVTYNDVAFAKSCGRTGHHYKDGLAFKFEDDLFETKLQMIEWTPGRTGEIAPVAVFAPVEIDGCEVSRASLHNLSFIEDLELMPGNRILVSKRNLIIPHVEDNLDRGGFVLESAYPHRCPCCGEPTRIHETRGRNENGEERTIKTLFCDNAGCETRKLKQFVHFVGKKAMNIEGLSEATLEKLIGRGWIHSYLDIYRLDQHKDELVRMDGFGERSWQRLWSAIQQSRNTTFERYVIAMDIPMIGNTASGVLCQVFHGNLDEFRDAVYAGYDFRQLPDFGDTLHNNIHEWFSKEENFCIWEELQMMMKIQKPVQPVAENNTQDNPFAGKTIVVTGKVEPYTRDEMNSLIASLGAIAGSSVTRKTHYLVCGEKAGSKLSKARELGIPVLEPQEFFRMAGVA